MRCIVTKRIAFAIKMLLTGRKTSSKSDYTCKDLHPLKNGNTPSVRRGRSIPHEGSTSLRYYLVSGYLAVRFSYLRHPVAYSEPPRRSEGATAIARARP